VIFRAGPMKAIFVEKDRLKADEPAVVVRVEGRPLFRFRRLLLSGPAVIEQRNGEAWLYTQEEVEGVKG
jgi:hypothetical protein